MPIREEREGNADLQFFSSRQISCAIFQGQPKGKKGRNWGKGLFFLSCSLQLRSELFRHLYVSVLYQGGCQSLRGWCTAFELFLALRCTRFRCLALGSGCPRGPSLRLYDVQQLLSVRKGNRFIRNISSWAMTALVHFRFWEKKTRT